jgi:RimJ/RimL family protein N-acetyltransferase
MASLRGIRAWQREYRSREWTFRRHGQPRYAMRFAPRRILATRLTHRAWRRLTTRPLSSLSCLTRRCTDHLAQREAGEGLLFVRDDGEGTILGYSDIQVWPEWAAGELGGALHPSQHRQGRGTRGAAESFTWMFEALHLDLICETASRENTATQRMLDGLGFTRKGEVTSTRPDGTTRASLVWEMTRDDWFRLHPA